MAQLDDWGLASGLDAINDTYGRRRSKDRGIKLMQQMEQSKIMRENRDIASQEAMAKWQDQINEYSSQLLAPDQQKVIDNAHSYQEEIQNKIKEFGGDISRFMANGGISLMNEYKNKVIYSDQSIKYKQNKENMNRILEIQAKGMADKLSYRDTANLQHYLATGEGDITYSGLLVDIEQLDATAFKFGENISPDRILHHKNNYQTILHNYLLEHPDDQNPSEQDLIDYTTMRYAQVGKAINKNPYSTTTGTGKGGKKTVDDIKKEKIKKSNNINLATATKNALLHIGRDGKVTGEQILDVNSIWEDNKTTNGLITSDFKDYEIDEWSGIINKEAKGIRGSKVLFGGVGKVVNNLTKSLYENDYDTETNTVTLNKAEVFNSTGTLGDDNEQVVAKPVKIVTAFVGNSPKEGRVVVMDALDKHGNIDPDRQKDLDDGYKDGLYEVTTMLVFKDEDGKMYMKEVNMKDQAILGVVDSALGDLNDTYATKKQAQLQKDENVKEGALAQNAVAQQKTRVQSIATIPQYKKNIYNVLDMNAINRPVEEVSAIAMMFSTAGGGKLDAENAILGSSKLNAILNSGTAEGEALREVLQDTSINFDTLLHKIKIIMTADGTSEAKIENELSNARRFYNTLRNS